MNVTLNKNLLFILSAIIFLFSLLYWNVFVDLVGIWNDKEEYSHGYIIPLVSLYFLWQKRELILAEHFHPSWFGVITAILAIAVYFVGVVGDVYFLLRFSFIFFLFGIALSVGGFKVTRIILIPILLIIFSFPLPPIFQAGLTAKLQLISSTLGVSFIRACEIPVFLEGNVIDLGNYKLQVVEACSGLRYLFPLMGLAFICAYMYQAVFWKRVVLFLSAIPITVLMNSFRIGVIGVLVENWGISLAEGFIHDFEGWIVFMACFVVLFIEIWVLSWNDLKKMGWENVFGLVEQTPNNSGSTPAINNFFPLLGVLGILILAVLTIKPLGEQIDIIPERKNFYDFPIQLSDWKGVPDVLEEDIIDFLGLSDYVLINFLNNKKKGVNFYVAYYQTQKHGVVPHSPKQCIPGGGWLISDISETVFSGIDFNRVVTIKEKNRQLVYYWYRQRGKNIANEYYLKWSTFVGAFKFQRTDAALIRLTTIVNSDESMKEADERLQQFMLLINNELKEYVPN